MLNHSFMRYLLLQVLTLGVAGAGVFKALSKAAVLFTPVFKRALAAALTVGRTAGLPA